MELLNLLFVHGQVSGQSPLVQPRFTCPKIDIFLFLEEIVCCGYSLEAPLSEVLLKSTHNIWFLRNMTPNQNENGTAILPQYCSNISVTLISC